jgi:hypothetical protein
MGAKGLKRSASRVESDEEETILPQTSKKTKTVAATGSGVDKDGNPFWEVIRNFRQVPQSPV